MHHDLFPQELDHCLTVLIASTVQVAPQECAEWTYIVRDAFPLTRRVAWLFQVVPCLRKPFEPLGELLAAGREVLQRNNLLLIRINEALQLPLSRLSLRVDTVPWFLELPLLPLLDVLPQGIFL
jgi:hypothetical protein